MDLLSGCKHTSFKALFAEGVGRNVAVTDSFPSPPVPPTDCRVTVIAFVPLGFLLGVFLAVPGIGQPGAARKGAGSLWLMRHK